MNISARCWPRSYEFGQVKDGNWDTRDEFEFQPGYERKKWKQVDFGSLRFEQTMFFASAQRHYEDGVPWEETEYYQAAVDAMAEGTMIHDWITTEEGLQADLRNMDRLYDSISDGYNTQKTLLEEGKSDASSFAELRRNEIRVDISRSGELLFAGGGKHRLTLAKLLELDWVPVVIIVRHKEWVQALESRYCETENHAPDWEALHLEEAGKANVETVSI